MKRIAMILTLLLAVCTTAQAQTYHGRYRLAQDDAAPKVEEIQAAPMDIGPITEGDDSVLDLPADAAPAPQEMKYQAPAGQAAMPYQTQPNGYYDHGVGFPGDCCRSYDPCAEQLWSNYCATKIPWCQRAHCRPFGWLRAKLHGCGCDTGCACEATCGCEASCGCEPSCAEPTCGCRAPALGFGAHHGGCRPTCGCAPTCCN